ncbi:MAG: hypothetical protein WC511_00530 [Candidatus Pacearchaeota archaeon]
MIEKKFTEGELFGYKVVTRGDGKYIIIQPQKIFRSATDTVNLLEELERRGYEFIFSEKPILENQVSYFRKK